MEAPASWPGIGQAGGESHPQACVRLEGTSGSPTPLRGGAGGRSGRRGSHPRPGLQSGQALGRELARTSRAWTRLAELGPGRQGAGWQGVGSGLRQVRGGRGRVQEGAASRHCQHCQGPVRASSCREGWRPANGWEVRACAEGRPWRGGPPPALGSQPLPTTARPCPSPHPWECTWPGGVEPPSPQDRPLSSPDPSLCPQMGTRPA